MTAMTMIEKILARASGKSHVQPGDIVVCRPDMVVGLDLPISSEGAWHRPKKSLIESVWCWSLIIVSQHQRLKMRME